MGFFIAKGKMQSLLTGDIALESLEIAEDEYNNQDAIDQFNSTFVEYYPQTPRKKCNGDNFGKCSRDVPPEEDIKWMCGDCGATNWTPKNKRCPECI